VNNTFAVLRSRDERKLWVSQILSSIGDNFGDMAIVWIATRQVGADAGLVVLAGSVAAIVFGLPGGVLVDRFDRRLTMTVVDTMRGLVLLALVAVLAFGEVALWHFAVATAINVGLGALFQPALIATVSIVSDSVAEKQAVNALMDVTARIAKAVAPGIAGVLLAVALPRDLFLLDALTFFVSAAAIYTLSRSRDWHPRQGQGAAMSVWADIREGWRAVRGHPVIRVLFPLKMASNMAWGMAFEIGVPLLVDTRFGGAPQLYGLIVAAYGAGNVIGNIMLGGLPVRRRAFVMFGGMVVFGAGFVMIGLAPTAVIAVFGAFFASFGGPMDDIMMLLYIQEDFHSHTVGKVYSLRVVLSEIGYAVGVGGAAVVYPLFGTAATIVACGLLVAACGFIGWSIFGLQPYSPHLAADAQ